MTLVLPFLTRTDYRNATEVLAALVAQGLGFHAEHDADRDGLPVLRVTFTGAH